MQTKSIFPAQTSDAAALARLINLANRDGLVAGVRTSAEVIERLITNPHAIIFKVTAGQQIIGCVDLVKSKTVLYVRNLTVHPRYRQQKLEVVLLQAAEQYAIQQQLLKMSLRLACQQIHLIALCQQQGFKAVGAQLPFCREESRACPAESPASIVLTKRLA